MSRFILMLFIWAFINSHSFAAEKKSVSSLKMPPGFSVAIYARVPNARSMVMGDGGTLFIGTRTDGRVFAVRDEDQDGYAERRITIAEGLDMPNGIAFRDGALFVAESGRILRYDRIEAHLENPPKPKLVAKLKKYRHHGWRYIDFGPDGLLYVAMGAPCNVCDPGELGSIVRVTDTGEVEPYIQGVRNSVGFTWHPADDSFWFTDNGRDHLGDDLPPDELNRATAKGQHFGYPYCHGGDIVDPEFDSRSCSDFIAPVQKLGPHVASLGVHIYDGKMFPKAYHHQVFIAEHGSWNRSERIGYRVSLVKMNGEKAVSYEPFIDGWLSNNGDVSGRPVDLLQMPDGSLLLSDDFRGRIYRISYSE